MIPEWDKKDEKNHNASAARAHRGCSLEWELMRALSALEVCSRWKYLQTFAIMNGVSEAGLSRKWVALERGRVRRLLENATDRPLTS